MVVQRRGLYGQFRIGLTDLGLSIVADYSVVGKFEISARRNGQTTMLR